MSDADEREGLLIIQSLYDLTKSILFKLDDTDYLIESVEKRGWLMDEFDAYRKNNPDDVQLSSEIRGLIDEIIDMDQKINASLVYQRNDVKRKIAENQAQQKRIQGFAANLPGAFGRRMNYSK